MATPAIPTAKIDGFVDANTIKRQKRVILSVEGKEKQGKTHFALSAPGPIAFINLDNGLEGVIHKHAEKQILIKHIKVPAAVGDVDKSKFLAVWKEYVKSYRAALANKDVKTVVIDTATAAWEVLRLASFGKVTQIMPYNYAPLNSEFGGLIEEAKDTDKNVIFLHQLKEKYKNDKPTGEFIRDGFNKAGYAVQTVIRCEFDGEFKIVFVDSRHDAKLKGEEFTGEMTSFDFISSLLTGM